MNSFFKLCALSAAALLMLTAVGCGKKTSTQDNSGNNTDSVSSGQTQADIEVKTDEMDFSFTEREADESFDSSAETLTSGKSVSITKEGTYILSGSYGRVTVDAPDTEKIQIVLKGADISDSSGPAIYIKEADKVFLTLAEGSENTVSDGAEYEGFSGDEENTDGAVFSRADLCINGSGSLKVTGNYKCGIVSKDDLVITGGKISINSAGSAIEGKDCVKLSGCDISVKAGGDGIRSTNDEDGARGYIYVESGNFDITATNDAFQAQTVLNIAGGDFSLTTGGGSVNSSSDSGGDWGHWGGFGGNYSSSAEDTTESAKALKAESLIKITGGSFNIDSSDDSLHCGGDLQIDGGSITAASGDDGIHSDSSVIINNGIIKISKSYEGIEGVGITVNGGDIDVTASDDGFNAAGGNDGSALGGRAGQNPFDVDEDAFIVINGGYVLVNASGDGIDSNGNVNMTDGILLVSGPTNSGNGSFDYGSSATISGGTAILTGSSGMAQSFSSSSGQPSVMYNIDSVSGGSAVAITDKNGKVLAAFTPEKQFSNVVISCSGMEIGSDYTISIGGSITGADENGFAQGGGVSGATAEYDITLSSVSTSNGSAGGMHGGGMGGGRPNKRF